jgi:hypothetical protein
MERGGEMFSKEDFEICDAIDIVLPRFCVQYLQTDLTAQSIRSYAYPTIETRTVDAFFCPLSKTF